VETRRVGSIQDISTYPAAYLSKHAFMYACMRTCMLI